MHPTADVVAQALSPLGVPLVLLLASGVTALMTGVVSLGAAFLEWGWRVAFVLSIVLIAVGYLVCRAADESPVFQEIAAAKKQPKVPIVQLVRRHGFLVIIAALISAGNNDAGYMAPEASFPATPPALLSATVLQTCSSPSLSVLQSGSFSRTARIPLTISQSDLGWRTAQGQPLLRNVHCLSALFRRLHLLRFGVHPRRTFAPTIARALIQATGGVRSRCTWSG